MSKNIEKKHCKDTGKNVTMMTGTNEKGEMTAKCMDEQNCKNKTENCSNSTYNGMSNPNNCK